jgi:hypothetical protein
MEVKMFRFLKNMFCRTDDLESRRKDALEQDRKVRESMSQKDWDREVQSTMAGSDPISKY